MKEKIDNEFKPRTWLLGILIFIALVIVVILINKIVLVSKERKENSKSLFDIFDNFFGNILSYCSGIISCIIIDIRSIPYQTVL